MTPGLPARPPRRPNGIKYLLAVDGQSIGYAWISQAPCAELGARDVEASVVLDYEPPTGLNPSGHVDAPDTEAHGQQIWRCWNRGSHVSTSGQGKAHLPSGKAQCAQEPSTEHAS